MKNSDVKERVRTNNCRLRKRSIKLAYILHIKDWVVEK